MERGPAKAMSERPQVVKMDTLKTQNTEKVIKKNPLKYDYYGKHKLSSNMNDLLQSDKLIQEDRKMKVT
jgi:hypothetical protein